ncbi:MULTISPECIES: hypothetical protein [Pectobacterium]|uniref:hypothetical protein n=1 Tax=Pectobacterium TaxID=122277 RepID=UPI00131DF781|nr:MULTISPECIES: hypothetical protein [Pectobacterium]
MSIKMTNWLGYTLIIALIPFIFRTLLSIATNMKFEIITIPDLVAFAFIMQVSTIGATEKLSHESAKTKTTLNISSIILIFSSGVFSLIPILGENFSESVDISSSTYLLMTICLFSTITSFISNAILENSNLDVKGA